MVDVAVVILNYNGAVHLRKYLPSIVVSSGIEKTSVSIVVVDNASSDDSVFYVKNMFPDSVSIIQLEKNYGFAEGYNRGLKQIEARYYVLLNSDVRTENGWLSPMYDMMESRGAIAACQPKILQDIANEDGSYSFEYSGGLGGWIDSLGYPFAIGRIFTHCEVDRGQYDIPQQLSWCCGAAMMLRANVYHKLGGMDAYLFAHQEEIDLCWRFLSMGYELWNCPSSVVHHLGGGTLPLQSRYKLFLNVRNNLILLAKNVSAFRFANIFIARMSVEWAFALVELMKGHPRTCLVIIKAYIAFIYWRLFVRRRNKHTGIKSMPRTGYYPKWIIWDYYARRKRTFAQLRFKLTK